MDDVRASSQEDENVAFFRQALTQAITYRLSFAQRESSNHLVLERELPNLWKAACQSYEQRAWNLVTAFRDALQPFLDLRGYWAQSLTLESIHNKGDFG